MRYITIMVDGASDNLTKMADKEIQIIVIMSKTLIVFGFIPVLLNLRFLSSTDILHIIYNKVNTFFENR